MYVATIIVGAFFGERVRAWAATLQHQRQQWRQAAGGCVRRPQQRRSGSALMFGVPAGLAAWLSIDAPPGRYAMQAVHAVGDGLWESNNKGVSRRALG